MTHTTQTPHISEPLCAQPHMGIRSRTRGPDPYTRSSDMARGWRQDGPPVKTADGTGGIAPCAASHPGQEQSGKQRGRVS
ncbi:hypothetical protein SBRY_50470 [Actinacidiphila bryophytorum]|uniref:Uncharacterized protein n=1 Tax=Actinacidiphila bryophytorum TaxID=1436133 RepID=A0A9W4MEW9_9ACTN|nr:hypothetical protein SBRY_50470 [Actinacidiphila bryophytorum]